MANRNLRFCRQTYRTGTGRLEVDFFFFNLGGDIGWRIYIFSDIDYKDKNATSHAAHWLKESCESYRYICWDGKISDLDGARTIAAIWAECTDRYIHGTQSFDTIASNIKHKVRWENLDD